MLQACLRNETLKQIMRSTNCSAKHLWKRAREVDSKLTRKNAHFDPTQSPELKEQRLEAAKLLMRYALRKFKSLVYVDECKIYMHNPWPYKCIMRKGDHVNIDIGLTNLHTLPPEATFVFSILLAVHPVHGCVYWALLSPSTGSKQKNKYKVSEPLYTSDSS